jgi:hypothetical protein
LGHGERGHKDGLAIVTFDLFSALTDTRVGAARPFAEIAGKRGWELSGEDVYDTPTPCGAWRGGASWWAPPGPPRRRDPPGQHVTQRTQHVAVGAMSTVDMPIACVS